MPPLSPTSASINARQSSTTDSFLSAELSASGKLVIGKRFSTTPLINATARRLDDVALVVRVVALVEGRVFRVDVDRRVEERRLVRGRRERHVERLRLPRKERDRRRDRTDENVARRDEDVRDHARGQPRLPDVADRNVREHRI